MDSSPSPVPGSANAAHLPGSRSKGGNSSVIHIWPNPLPLECGVIRLQEKLSTAAGATKHGGSASGGQKFPLKVSQFQYQSQDCVSICGLSVEEISMVIVDFHSN